MSDNPHRRATVRAHIAICVTTLVAGITLVLAGEATAFQVFEVVTPLLALRPGEDGGPPDAVTHCKKCNEK